MIALDPAAEPAKSRRRPVAKATRPKPEEKTKIGLYISVESARRLGITATMEGLDRSRIVDDLIRQHCRKYVVQVRSTRPEDSASVPEESSAA
jgi:hypothetical protein